MKTFVLVIMLAAAYMVYGGGSSVRNLVDSLRPSPAPVSESDRYDKYADEQLPDEQDEQALSEQQSEGRAVYYTGGREEVDPEEGYQTKLLMNPLMVTLIETDEEDLRIMVSSGIAKLESVDRVARTALIVLSVTLLILMLCTFRSGFSGPVGLMAGISFTLSNLYIFLISFVCIGAWVAFKYNSMLHLNGLTFSGPLILLLCSAGSLKIYDFNRPFWNRIYFSSFCLTVTALVIRFV